MKATKFDNASDSFKRLNPHLFGGVALPSPKSEPRQSRPLDNQDAVRQERKFRMVGCGKQIMRVAIISLRSRELDKDNLTGGSKPLRDAIARWFGLDDHDDTVHWEYHQVITKQRTGTAVRIEVL